MRVLQFLLTTSGLAAGVLAAPAEGAPAVVAARDYCVDNTLAYSTMWDESGDDFTQDGNDYAKRDEAHPAPPAPPVPVEELNISDLSARAQNWHWCYNASDYWGRGGSTILDDYSRAAVGQGWNLMATGRRVYNSWGSTFYPKRFWNSENIDTVSNLCPGGPWFEFPVLDDGRLFDGVYVNQPGGDRVVFNACGNWCATISHRGLTGNAFHDCVGFSR